ncbi:MAG: family 10 glycosylhydrolase [Candidatus Marinimicrobia bacterium]|nr:family 10 glycosylhydrolase [Candidatus Neomarinimicrobiota bacterium]
MKKIIYSILILVFLFSGLFGQTQELRGAWVAWAGTNVPSTDQIVTTMNKLADANFNIVYVDVWRYGYPYFKSEVFHKYSGHYTDPNLADHDQPTRDVLAEMVVEAHRAGLQVEAWFEAGFNGAANTSSPLFQRQPEWFAKKKDGSTAYYGQAGPSMIHCHPEVQQFLIDLAQEIVQKYDVDGIQLDRIRYPSHDCGYDSLTINLYKQEHDGSEPPTDISDQEWVQWRADKLTEFVGRFYDSLKTTNPETIISNATIPWGPIEFCQDWSEWANNGHLDIVVPMLYYNSNSYFTDQLENNSELTQVNDFNLIYPGVTTIANGSYTDPDQLEGMINTTREKELGGNVHWFHANLIWHENDYLTHMKETVYSQPSLIPYRSSNWRLPTEIVDDTSSSTIKTDGWQKYSGGIPLYNGQCIYADAGNNDSLIYYFDIEKSGWYEIYTFVNTQVNASSEAHYTINSKNGEQVNLVDQTVSGNAGRWEKLSDIYLEAGSNQKILTLNAAKSNGSYVFADAVMLLNTNRPEKYITSVINQDQNNSKIQTSNTFELEQNYPNPFNTSTIIKFNIEQRDEYNLSIFDIRGNRVKLLLDRELNQGSYRINCNMDELSSGLYFYRLSSSGNSLIKKMVLIK